jgi:SAM domain (Sterile alpha motif)
MSEIRKWLETIGLDQYANAFEANDIDMELLKQVDDQTLKDIGVSIGGHRLHIRDAIARAAEANRGNRAAEDQRPEPSFTGDASPSAWRSDTIAAITVQICCSDKVPPHAGIKCPARFRPK